MHIILYYLNLNYYGLEWIFYKNKGHIKYCRLQGCACNLSLLLYFLLESLEIDLALLNPACLL